VPLSRRRVIVKQLSEAKSSAYVFPGQKRDKPLSNMAMLMLLERMGGAARQPRMASAPRFGLGVGSQPVLVGAARNRAGAYDRQQSRSRISAGDALEKRRAMMDAWRGTARAAGDNVVALKRPA